MLPGHFGQQGKNELPTAQEPNEASQEEEKEEKAPVPDTLDVLKEYAGLPLTRSIQLKAVGLWWYGIQSASLQDV